MNIHDDRRMIWREMGTPQRISISFDSPESTSSKEPLMKMFYSMVLVHGVLKVIRDLPHKMLLLIFASLIVQGFLFKNVCILFFGSKHGTGFFIIPKLSLIRTTKLGVSNSYFLCLLRIKIPPCPPKVIPNFIHRVLKNRTSQLL